MRYHLIDNIKKIPDFVLLSCVRIFSQLTNALQKHGDKLC